MKYRLPSFLMAISIAITSFVNADPPAVPAQTPFRAGAVAVDISPHDFPVRVNGMFTERMATKTVDPLFAKALALDDGATRIVLCVVDTCMMDRALIDAAKAQASQATGIPMSRMMVSATHTHSAPSAMGCLGSRVDPAYAAFLPGKIAEAIAGAVRALQPARIGWSVVDDWNHTFNRRWIRRPDRMLKDPFGDTTVRAHMHPGYLSPDVIGPSGPVDPALSVIAVQTPDGRPLAVLANYSMHYVSSDLLSSDYFGRFAQHLAAKLNASPEFVGIMSQGTSGDLWLGDYGSAQRPFHYDTFAQEMADRAVDAMKAIQWQDSAPIGMAERLLTLDYRVPSESRLAWARQMVAGLGERIPQTQPEIYAAEALELHARQKTELKLQAVRLGTLGLTAIPNEVVALTGLKLKRQSPLVPTVNIELANGAEGYIPPPEQHRLGGYITWPARTAGLEVQAEPRIAETLLGLLEEVAGKPRRAVAAATGPYPATVLAAKPLAYWRLDDMAGAVAADSSGHDCVATIENGAAFYLPGAGSGTGAFPDPMLKPSAFSGNEINRSMHFAGGRLSARPAIGATYSVEFWFWNGLPNDARAVTGYLCSHGPDGSAQTSGEHLGIAGSHLSGQNGRLFVFSGNTRSGLLHGKTVIDPKSWHHVLFIREGKNVRVHLDGNREPEIAGELESDAHAGDPLFLAGRNDNFANLEGRLDEVAVYDRVLTADEFEQHWKAAAVLQAGR